MGQQFRYGHSGRSDWKSAATACLEQLGTGAGTLGFLYFTDLLADHAAEMLALFRERTGVEHWVGGTGLGICATGREYLDEPAVAAMIADFDPDSFTLFSGVNSVADIQNLRMQCTGGSANFAIVHADPLSRRIPEMVAKLAGRVESGFLVGGLTSSRGRHVQIADGVSEGGLSGVAFSDAVTVATRLTQGCSPLGARHAITECQRNVAVMLDGRPALDVMKSDIGDLAQDMGRIGGTVFVGLPIAGSDTGDYIVRNLVGIDPANKLVAVGEMLRAGESLMFCRRDAATAREDMTRMLESIRQGLYSAPRGGVYYSCLGRGEGLFGAGSQELKMISDVLGNCPLVGYFCNGEISHNRLYGYTGVLTLFL